MIINDLLSVLYAPHKAFKKIAENPKYLGVIIIVVLFLAVQAGYYTSFYSKVYYEQTSPSTDDLTAFTANSTIWKINQGGNVNLNYNDFINETYLGNSSLRFNFSNSNNLTIALNDFGYSVDCSQNGFQNLSLRIKQVYPIDLPQRAIVTLYCSNDTSSYFQYDLTSMLASGTVNEWNNLTTSIGTSNWQSTGSANWSDITGLKLELTYSSASDITVMIQGLFFHGQFSTEMTNLGGLTFAGYIVYQIALDFLFQWIILSAITYFILKGLKVANVVWKPVFITIGYTLIVVVITSLLSIIATFTMPAVYYPYDFMAILYPGSFAPASVQSQSAYSTILTATSMFTNLRIVITMIMFAWESALVAIAMRVSFGLSWGKSSAVAIGSVILSYLAISLLTALGFI